MDRQATSRWRMAAREGATPLLPPHPIARWLLVIVLAAGAYFFRGFLVPVLAALIVGFASWPLYQRLVRGVGGSTALAATIALLTIIAVLIVPIAIAVSYAVAEARIWAEWLIEANTHGAPTPDWIRDLPLVGDWLGGHWDTYLSHPKALGELLALTSGENVGSIYRIALAASGQTFHVVLSILFALIALFFVYKDGTSLTGQLDRVGERVLPGRWQTFSRVVPATISATVVGMGLIAVGEGIVLGIAYWIAGVPSPVFLGVLTGIMALVPGGAPTAFTLVSLYLVGRGDAVAGLALLAWGSVELFIVDKTLRPHLVGGPIKLPFLATFFGLIGGVATMGLVGLFIGPVLMALLVAIWREWLRQIDGGADAAEGYGPPPAPEDLVAAPAPAPAPASAALPREPAARP